LPESFAYRLKRLLLGPPLVSEHLSGQRLGKPTALAVLSSDVMSSSAYATEEILRILIPVGGLAAFALVSPITAVILVVLVVVTLCYRDVVRAYPKAGGSYVVSRDNFGPNLAQIAGAALLISYTITVAVSVAAGADAVISAAPSLSGAAVPMSIAFVVLLAYGNLRGIREAGKVFAAPTYFFIANMALLIGAGLVRAALGTLGHAPRQAGTMALGHKGGGLFLGISAFFVLRAFANGGSAMTGTEAISNGVSVFRDPQPRNARTTLVLMSTILGAMFLGVSVLAALTHAVPFVSGTPTVVSEIGRLVYGTSSIGHLGFYLLQTATALILVLAANTSFTGFPFLVSFVAEDSFLPRMLTIRGHRLVFSNGILVLAATSIALLVATGAQVASLIPMYAIGVFTGFTMAGAGMLRHHLRLREPGWRRGAVVNAIAAVVCAIVVVVFAVTEFTRGAWVVVVVMPILVYALIRTNRQYRSEDAVLEEGAAIEACEAKILRRHSVVILVDRIDLATARAIQYARSLMPDDLRAVHFNVDDRLADLLIGRWQQLGLTRLPLDVVDCPDRRLTRAALELAAGLADGETEVSLLLPRRSYGRAWRRILHDQTADRIVDVVSGLSHVNATIVPFLVAADEGRRRLHLSGRETPATQAAKGAAHKAPPREIPSMPPVAGTVPIAHLRWREPARVAGRVRSLRVQPLAGVPTLETVLDDGSGQGLLVVFLGRRSVAGVRTGTRMIVEGMVGKHNGKLAIINPLYELVGTPEAVTGTDA
jgi:amino acid transporter